MFVEFARMIAHAWTSAKIPENNDVRTSLAGKVRSSQLADQQNKSHDTQCTDERQHRSEGETKTASSKISNERFGDRQPILSFL